MYLDTVVVSGLVIVILTCVMLVYVCRYVMRHIRADEQKYLASQNRSKDRVAVGEGRGVEGA